MSKPHDQHILLDEQGRRDSVTNFILNHPGCTAEDIYEAEGTNCRPKLFKILDNLKAEGIVIEKRSELNKRNIPLYVNDKNHLVIVPREIDEFEEAFVKFIDEVVDRRSPLIHLFLASIGVRLDEYKKDLGKNIDADLTIRELDGLPIDADAELHTDLQFLSFEISLLVKAIQIFNEFVRAYTNRYIVEWPVKIKDEKTVGELVALASIKISKLQIRVMKMMNPLLQGFYSKTGRLLQIDEGQLDTNEILAHYKYFELDAEVEPVLKQLSKIRSTDLEKRLALPLEKWGVISPTEVGSDTLYALQEMFNPEEYYEDYEEQLYQEEFLKSMSVDPSTTSADAATAE